MLFVYHHLLACMSTWGDFVFCKTNSSVTSSCKDKHRFILVSVWIIGFLFGSWIGWGSRYIFRNVIETANLRLLDGPEFYLLFFAPIFAALLVMRFKRKLVLYTLLFIEAIAYGAVLIGVSCCSLQYGWLLAVLLLWPKLILQFLVLLRITGGLPLSASYAIRNLISFLTVILLVLFTGYKWILPIVCTLIDQI